MGGQREEEQPWTSPSLGGTEYSGPSLSVSKEEKELSETHAADGGSMKLGLKGISVSWWETGEEKTPELRHHRVLEGGLGEQPLPRAVRWGERGCRFRPSW